MSLKPYAVIITHRGNPQPVMKYPLPDASMSQKPHFFSLCVTPSRPRRCAAPN